MKILGYPVTIDGHNIIIEGEYDNVQMMNIIDYMVKEGFLDMQIWCQENGIF